MNKYSKIIFNLFLGLTISGLGFYLKYKSNGIELPVFLYAGLFSLAGLIITALVVLLKKGRSDATLGNLFSKLSLISVTLGVSLLIIGIGYIQQLYVLFPGIILYILSLVVSIIAFSKRETSFLKFIPFLFLIPIIPFVLFIYSGQI